MNEDLEQQRVQSPARKVTSVILALFALIYDISPIDLSPDAIPFLGWLDDGALTITALLNLAQQFVSDPESLKARILQKLKWIAFFASVFVIATAGGIISLIIALVSGEGVSLVQFLWVIAILLLIIVSLMYLFQNRIVGFLGEHYTAFNIRKSTWGKIFRDVYVNGSHGVQQIDLIAVTPRGILVIEKKTYIGRIVGNAYDKQWRVFVGRNKTPFYMKNPHHQNFGHVQALVERCPALKDKFIDLVIFGNNARLGANPEPNTINDKTFANYYATLPQIVSKGEMNAFIQSINELNKEKAALKRLHKEKIKGTIF